MWFVWPSELSLEHQSRSTSHFRFSASDGEWFNATNTFASERSRVQFNALKRRWPFIIFGFVLLLVVAGAALQIDWTWKRKLSPWGGRYFFRRTELPVPSFRQADEKSGDDPLGELKPMAHSAAKVVPWPRRLWYLNFMASTLIRSS